LLPAGAKVAGWDFHPQEDRALARRTLTFELTGALRQVAKALK